MASDNSNSSIIDVISPNKYELDQENVPPIHNEQTGDIGDNSNFDQRRLKLETIGKLIFHALLQKKIQLMKLVFFSHCYRRCEIEINQ